MKFNWKALLLLLSVIAAWHFISGSGLANNALFPGPFVVLQAGINWFASGELANDIAASIWRMAAGLIFGASLGVLSGLLMGRVFFLEETAAPLLHILRAFPPVAIIPLVILWFGVGDAAKIFSIAFAAFFPVWISAFIGAKSISVGYLKVAKLYSKSPVETFSKVVVPATLPFLGNGIRIGIGVAFIMVFVSELAGASVGLGYRIAFAQITYQADAMLAGLIVLGVIAALTDFAFTRAYRKIFPWVAINE